MSAAIEPAIFTASFREPGALSDNIRVLTITPFYPSALDASQGRFVSGPLERIAEFGISNETVAVQPFYRRGSRAKNTWANYFAIPGNLGLASAGGFLGARLSRKINERNRHFDLIHAHAALPCGHAAAVLSKRLGIPFAVTVHGLDAFFTRQGGSLFGRLCRRAAEHVYRSARAVICISEKVREEVLKGVPANTKLVYNGIDPELFSPSGEGDLQRTVLSVGNLIPTKGHLDLLRAFAAATSDMPDCKLEIIGDGPERGRLMGRAADLGIASRTVFRGRRTQEYVADAMRRCSVFALPSRYEGLGCVYLEAMACAKPVIACHGQGIGEIIEHERNGFLVAPADISQLSDSLHELLLKPNLCRQIGAAARNLILQRFTLEHQAKQLAAIYRECAA